MSTYELRIKEDPDFPEETETFPKFYSVVAMDWLEAAAALTKLTGRAKGLNVSYLTVDDILGMFS